MNCRSVVADALMTVLTLAVVLFAALPSWAQDRKPVASDKQAAAKAPAGADVAEGLRVAMRVDAPIVQAGRPVWAEFSVVNLSADLRVLAVPGADVTKSSPRAGMGLPVAHVFSGGPVGSLSFYDDQGKLIHNRSGDPVFKQAPLLSLAERAGVSVRVDLGRYYPFLERPGVYKLQWFPYDGAVHSEVVELTILAEQQAIILTDFGKITLRFNYDKAPNHVQNFLDLARSGFYNHLRFHRVVPGGLIQGGDPRGDGFGIRKDRKRLKAEFNDIPFELGTVGMARTPNDPDSASSQFFICLSRQPSFDGQQTAFAYVVHDESFATLQKIAVVPTGEKDRPNQPVYIRAVSLENVPDRERVNDEPALSVEPNEAAPKRREPGIDNPVTPKKTVKGRGVRAVYKPKATTTPADAEAQ